MRPAQSHKPNPARISGLSGGLAFLLAGVLVSLPVNVTAEEDPSALYSEHCETCHGEQGNGMTRVRRGLNPPPRDFTTPLAKLELTRDRMLASVRNGRSGTAMMGFAPRLSEVEIASLVDYIRDRFMLKTPVAVDDSMRDRAAGERIYVTNCSVCHGDEGNGAMWTKNSLNPPPRDFTATAPAELPRERMLASVTNGRPGTAMMSFAKRLPPQDIEHVVDYVRATFLGRGMTARAGPPHGAMGGTVSAAPIVPADMTLPLPNALIGDAVWGAQFYKKNCFNCHGEQGDGNGPRAVFNTPRPRNFLADDARRTLNRPALFKAITAGKNGTVMPAWGKVLSEQEIANIAEYVFQTFIQPKTDTGKPASAVSSPSDDKKKAPS